MIITRNTVTFGNVYVADRCRTCDGKGGRTSGINAKGEIYSGSECHECKGFGISLKPFTGMAENGEPTKSYTTKIGEA